MQSFPAPTTETQGTVSLRPVLFPVWKSTLVLLMGAATIAACLLSDGPHTPSQPGVVMQLPDHVGDFWGYPMGMSYAEKSTLPSDTEFVRKDYESFTGDSIICSIVLSGAERRSIHRPENCLPGQGWTIQSIEINDVPLQSGRTLKVMSLFITRPVDDGRNGKKTVSACYLYWFVGQNVVTPNHWQRIWLSSWDRIVHHVTHRWAYVTVCSIITQGFKPDGKDRTQTLDMMKSFIREVVPSFQIAQPAD